MADLWSLNRVHAGVETSAAYAMLAGHYPGTSVFGYDSGMRCGSWVAPPAWAVKTAQLTDSDGTMIADFQNHPLHVYCYSPSFEGHMSLAELNDHLMSDPKRPNDIPFHFRNQYRHWAPTWGFCLPHSVRENLTDGEYHIQIETEFSPGRLEMAEQTHAGELSDSVLFVGHFDHPAMCNDGLVGCLAGHEVITRLAGKKTHLSYRMLSTIEIIGSVFYAEKRAKEADVREALFVATPGADSPLAYQTSAAGTGVVDRIVEHVLTHALPEARITGFREILGNDEVAFDVGGVDIPCGCLVRYPFPQYHTSADTPDTVDEEKFEEVVDLLNQVIHVLENDGLIARKFSGLPCLSNPELDLYLSPTTVSGIREQPTGVVSELLERLPDARSRAQAEAVEDRYFGLMNILPTMADGTFTVLDVAERLAVPFALVSAYVDMWVDRGLLDRTWKNPFENKDD